MFKAGFIICDQQKRDEESKMGRKKIFDINLKTIFNKVLKNY